MGFFCVFKAQGMCTRRFPSSKFYHYAVLALVLYVIQLPCSLSKPSVSEDNINDAIRDAVNDGFTITREDKDDFDGDLRIVDGVDAKLGELPYQCALEFKSSGFSYCGAALIDPLETNKPEYLITAAHCVKNRAADTLEAVCGVLKMSKTRDVNRFPVKRIEQHPYNSDTKIGDLAILQLEVNSRQIETHRSESSNNMAPIKAPDMTVFSKFSGTDCIVSGWGRQASGGSTKPDTLKKGTVLVPTQERCAEMYTNVTDKFKKDSMMCAGGADVDGCQGDSGGPLMCKVDGKSYLAGLVSWGIGCATEGVPGGYTNVANYHKWIVETVDSFENGNS